MQNRAEEIPLHDIKTIIEIQEYSLYYTVLVGVIALVILSVALYLLVRYIRKKRERTLRKIHLEFLKNLEMRDSKKSAYALTLYGATFKDDTPEIYVLYKELVDSLASYKYRKNVEEMDIKTQELIGKFMESIDAK